MLTGVRDENFEQGVKTEGVNPVAEQTIPGTEFRSAGPRARPQVAQSPPFCLQPSKALWQARCSQKASPKCLVNALHTAQLHPAISSHSTDGSTSHGITS